MTRRKFIKGTTATAIGAAAVAQSTTKSASAQSKRAKTPRRKILTERVRKPLGPYSQAIVAGNTVYVAGQGPFDPKTGEMPAKFEDQVAMTLENIKGILEAAGATMADVVKVNVYLADLNNFQKMNEVYRRYFKEDYPARATVGTQLLGEMTIEIECIAVI